MRFEKFGRELKAGLLAGGNEDRCRLIEEHLIRVGYPIGRGDDHFVTSFEQGLGEVVEGVFGAAGDQNLAFLIGEALISPELLEDGLLQVIRAAGRRVFGESVSDCCDAGFLDGRRCVKIRFP